MKQFHNCVSSFLKKRLYFFLLNLLPFVVIGQSQEPWERWGADMATKE